MNSKPRCPVCQGEQGLRFVEGCGEYTLYHCVSCDLVFSDPMKSEDSRWFEKAYLVRHLAIDDRIMWYFSWALRNLPEKGKLLDVGCGAGTFVSYALKAGFETYGIDLSMEAIEAGKRRFGLTTLFATTLEDFRAARSDDGFDAVTMFEVLEHVESPIYFLQATKRLLKPAGCIALSVPNRDRWPIRDFADYPPNHLTRWSERSVRKLLDASGFEVLKLERTPILLSINFFFGYLLRVCLYKMLKLHTKGLSGAKDATVTSRSASLQQVGKIGSKSRRYRDALMWIPTLVSLPVFYPIFGGYNIVALARAKPWGAGQFSVERQRLAS